MRRGGKIQLVVERTKIELTYFSPKKQPYQARIQLSKDVSQKCLICHAPKNVGGEEIFNFPMLHIASHFCVFSRNFQSFLTLSKQQLLHFLGGVLQRKLQRNTHMTTIFANYLKLYIIKLKYRYLKVLYKI